MTKQRTEINKLVGILESGEILYIDNLHWNGVSCNIFDYLTAEMVTDRNDIDELKDSYGYLWQEAVANGTTKQNLEEYMEGLIEAEVNYGEGYFLGHDTSYIHHITRDDLSKLEEYYGTTIETFECVGGGTGWLKKQKFAKIFDQELLDRALKHEVTIDSI